jgi:sugar phosphate isomerase/epimerase
VLWDGQYERPYWEPHPNYVKELEQMKTEGVETVELCISGCWLKETVLEYAEYGLEEIKKAGLKLASVHMPFAVEHINLSATNEEELGKTLDYVKEIFKITEQYSPDAYVFHPGGKKEDNPEKCMQSLIRSCTELKQYTKAKICIENMVRSTFFERADQVKYFLDNTDGIYTCVDVNHFLHDNPEDAILLYGNKIGAVHISDNHRVDEEHIMPGEGLINWDKVVEAFNTVNYKGQINYETSMKKFGYTFEDVKNNYKKIFSNINK